MSPTARSGSPSSGYVAMPATASAVAYAKRHPTVSSPNGWIRARKPPYAGASATEMAVSALAVDGSNPTRVVRDEQRRPLRPGRERQRGGRRVTPRRETAERHIARRERLDPLFRRRARDAVSNQSSSAPHDELHLTVVRRAKRQSANLLVRAVFPDELERARRVRSLRGFANRAAQSKDADASARVGDGGVRTRGASSDVTTRVTA